MDILRRIPEHLRGWFYFIAALVFLVMLVAMFVLAVMRGEDLSNWLFFVLSVLGLAGSGLASANTNRDSKPDSGRDLSR